MIISLEKDIIIICYFAALAYVHRVYNAKNTNLRVLTGVYSYKIRLYLTPIRIAAGMHLGRGGLVQHASPVYTHNLWYTTAKWKSTHHTRVVWRRLLL